MPNEHQGTSESTGATSRGGQGSSNRGWHNIRNSIDNIRGYNGAAGGPAGATVVMTATTDLPNVGMLHSSPQAIYAQPITVQAVPNGHPSVLPTGPQTFYTVSPSIVYAPASALPSGGSAAANAGLPSTQTIYAAQSSPMVYATTSDSNGQQLAGPYMAAGPVTTVIAAPCTAPLYCPMCQGAAVTVDHHSQQQQQHQQQQQQQQQAYYASGYPATSYYNIYAAAAAQPAGGIQQPQQMHAQQHQPITYVQPGYQPVYYNYITTTPNASAQNIAHQPQFYANPQGISQQQSQGQSQHHGPSTSQQSRQLSSYASRTNIHGAGPTSS